MKVLLKFRSAWKLTISADGEPFAHFVAMGFKQREIPLPNGEMGLELRYVVNSPERFEHVLKCTIVSDEPTHVVVETVSDDPTNEMSYVYSFEPLTYEVWKTMNVIGGDELAKEIKTTDDLVNYYWNDWVPEYWTT